MRRPLLNGGKGIGNDIGEGPLQQSVSHAKAATIFTGSPMLASILTDGSSVMPYRCEQGAEVPAAPKNMLPTIIQTEQVPSRVWLRLSPVMGPAPGMLHGDPTDSFGGT